MQDNFNPYRDWLGIPDAKARPNHYRLLGLRLFEDNPGVIQSAVARWKSMLEGHLAGERRAAAAALIAEIERAGQLLLQPAQRAVYDQQLRSQLLSGATPQIVAGGGQNAGLPLPPGMSPSMGSAATSNAEDSAVFDSSLLPPGAESPTAHPVASTGYAQPSGYANVAVPNYGAPAAPAYGMPLPPGMQSPAMPHPTMAQPQAMYPAQNSYGQPQPAYGMPQPTYGLPQPGYAANDWQSTVPTALPGTMPGYAPQATPVGYAPQAVPIPGYPAATAPLASGFDPMGGMGASAAPMAAGFGAAPAIGQPWSQPHMPETGFGATQGVDHAASFLGEAAVPHITAVAADAHSPALAPTISAPASLTERSERSSIAAYVGAGTVAIFAVVALLVMFKKDRPAPPVSTALAQGQSTTSQVNTSSNGNSASSSSTTSATPGSTNPAASSGNGNGGNKLPADNPGQFNPPQVGTTPQPMPVVTPMPADTSSTPNTTPVTPTMPPTVVPPDTTTPTSPTPTTTTPTNPTPTPTIPPTPTTPTPPEPPVTTPPMPMPTTPASASPAGVALLASRWSLSQRDLPTASAKLAEARRTDTGKQLENEINRQEALVHYSEEFWRAVREAIKALVPGDQATIGGTIVGVVEVNPDRFILRVAGQNRTYQVDSLPPKLAFGLAEGWLNKGDPVSKIILGTFHACDASGTRDTARSLWQEAASLGRKEDVDVLLPELNVPLPEQPEAPSVAGTTPSGSSSSGLTAADLKLKPNADGKFPPPGATVQSKGRAEVLQMFEADFGEAKDPTQWAALASTLVARADEMKENPVLRYSLLVEARDLAGKAGQFDQVVSTIDKLSEVFVIDALDTKADSLSDASKQATTPELQAALVQTALAVCDEAVLLEKSGPALKLARVALATARKNGDMELIKTCIAREKEVRDLK